MHGALLVTRSVPWSLCNFCSFGASKREMAEKTDVTEIKNFEKSDFHRSSTSTAAMTGEKKVFDEWGFCWKIEFEFENGGLPLHDLRWFSTS